MTIWIFIIFIILILLCFYIYCNKKTNEYFNEQSGKFCPSCSNKTFNQCLSCFNCGFCVDKWGNSNCIGGDLNGGYNKEKCAFWYYIDPYSRMIQQGHAFHAKHEASEACN